ncbi:MAG: thiolase family protein [Mariprofundales bacterium]
MQDKINKTNKAKEANQEVVVVSGVRTPYGKAGGALAALDAVDLGAASVRELLARSAISAQQIDVVIIGNVIQPSNAANIARVVALRAGLPKHIPAHTVHRNCASGMQAITESMELISSGRAEVLLAGGIESMTHAPLLFDDKFRAAMAKLQRAKSPLQKMKSAWGVCRAPWQPRIALLEGFHDPIAKMGMGQTAELLAREFNISRAEQDQFSVQSHKRAQQAWEDGWFDDEVMRMYAPPSFAEVQYDEGIRNGQNMQALGKLRPVFDKPLGSVTAGNSSQITDGAAMLLLTNKEKAIAEGWPILGYLHDWAYAGCDPKRMGLGPVFASRKLLEPHGLTLDDMQRVEINEAFAAQTLAVMQAFADSPLGSLEVEKLNVHGGAIALGHPVGSTGARLILTLLRQLKLDTEGGLGLASLCIGGGQGGAVLLGSESWK